MTGERLAWFRVASHLHTSVEELAGKITLSEFQDWLQYLEWEQNYHSKQDYYLAQIAAEIRKTRVKHPQKVKIDHLLMKFKRKVQDSKATWLSFFGLKAKK